MPSRPRRQPVATDKRFRKSSGLSDHGPMERWQHSGRVLELTERAGVLAARATEEHVVDSLVTARLLAPRQREAALKFKLDFQRAGIAARVTGSYSPVQAEAGRGYGRRERSDIEEASYRRWRNAIGALGLRLSGIVIGTACHDLPPARNDIALLREGLDRLAAWYRLPKHEDAGPAVNAARGEGRT